MAALTGSLTGTPSPVVTAVAAHLLARAASGAVLAADEQRLADVVAELLSGAGG